MMKTLEHYPINRANIYNRHNVEITLLNDKLKCIYGDKTLSFRRDNIESNNDIDNYVSAVIAAYTQEKQEDTKIPPIFHLTNPYSEELYEFRHKYYESNRYPRTEFESSYSVEKYINTTEKSKFIEFYNLVEQIFTNLEMLKQKYCKEYIPNGVKLYYEEDSNNQTKDQTFEKCNFCEIFESCYLKHKGIALNKQLVKRLDANYTWRQMIKAERATKEILNGRKLKNVIEGLSWQNDKFLKTIACIILTIVLK